MGMASHSSLHNLCARLESAYQWLRQAALASGTAIEQPPTPASQPGSPTQQRHRDTPAERLRPTRANWPFTVRPDVSPRGTPHAAPTKVLREPTSGRLVIAGRMADVCAELDRLAATEALQA